MVHFLFVYAPSRFFVGYPGAGGEKNRSEVIQMNLLTNTLELNYGKGTTTAQR